MTKMRRHPVGRLLDTNICIAYMKACARTEQKQTPAQKQVFKKLESIKNDMTLCMSEVTLGEYSVLKNRKTKKIV